jgi:hypothetical protein
LNQKGLNSFLETTPANQRMSHWIRVVLLFGLFIVCAVAYLWVRSWEIPLLRAPNGKYVLGDPDSYLRWRLVERALEGEGVRIRWIPDDNPPSGRLNEHTVPMTVVSVLTVRTAQFFGKISLDRSMELCRLWLGPVIGLCSLAALACFGVRTAGWPLAVCWMTAWPALGDICGHTRFGNTDHHSFHQFLFICIVGGVLASRLKPGKGGGVFLGLACALAIWSAASEFLPMLGLLAALVLYELRSKQGKTSPVVYWRAWWVSGFVATTMAWLFEFWPHPFHRYLEMLSVWQVMVWVTLGALLEYSVRRRSTNLEWGIGLACAALLLILAAGMLRGFDWSHLHVVQDERFRQFSMASNESKSFWGGSLEDTLERAWRLYGLMPFVALSLFRSSGWREPRQKWLLIGLAAYFVLMLHEIRWADFFVVTMTMAAGLAMYNRFKRRPWLGIVLIGLATLPPWWLAIGIHRDAKKIEGNPMYNPHRVTFTLEAAAECFGQSGHKPVVLTDWHSGAKLMGTGRARILGSANWPNLEGWSALHELYATTNEACFWRLIRERQISYLLIPGREELFQQVEQSYEFTYRTKPKFQQATDSILWKLVSEGRLPPVPCDELNRVAPDWKIFAVPPEQVLRAVGATKHAGH